jgi:hypothetical protein
MTVLFTHHYYVSRYHNKDSQPFHVVAAMLRLGRKYNIPRFKDDAVSRIHDEFPTSRLGPYSVEATRNAFSRIDEYPSLFCDLLNLAYETGIHSSVPGIAYCCLAKFTLVRRTSTHLFSPPLTSDGC